MMIRKFVYFPDLNEERVFIRVNPAWIYMLSIAPFIQTGEELSRHMLACYAVRRLLINSRRIK